MKANAGSPPALLKGAALDTNALRSSTSGLSDTQYQLDMFSPSLLAICMAALAYGNIVTRSMQVHESLPSAPPAFTLAGPASPDIVLDLRIAMVNSNIAGLEKALMDVSTPGNALYGQHLTKEEVGQFVAPTAETVSAVTAWLKENGIEATQASPAGDWLSFSIPVSKANEMLDANFSVFTDTKSGTTSIRTLSYSIPSNLEGHLDFVHPTTAFVQPPGSGPVFTAPAPLRNETIAHNLTSNAVPQQCDSQIVPACLQALYGIPTTPATVESNRLGVSGFIGQYANEADLETFLFNFRPDIPPTTTFTLETLDGGSNPQDPSQAGLEANLDIQYTVGIASEVPTTFYSVGPNNNDGLGGFIDLATSILNDPNRPTVLSTSYGFNEPGVPSGLANSLCNIYLQLGAVGTSVLFSSGDGGVSGSQDQSCTTFIPTFPSGCPYATSVGATQNITETAAAFSSGGFSNIFPQPSYQDAAVSAYLSKLGNINAGLFNSGGRGFPDVSAQGVHYVIVVGGQGMLVDGTSASTPVFASIIALLNDELAAEGRPPLGFLNPFLYSAQGIAALNDVTTGDNPGCGTNGFPATSGWDPVTGLGTPNYAKLRSAIGLL